MAKKIRSENLGHGLICFQGCLRKRTEERESPLRRPTATAGPINGFLSAAREMVLLDGIIRGRTTFRIIYLRNK